MDLLFQLRVSPHEGTLLQGQQTVLARDLGGCLELKPEIHTYLWPSYLKAFVCQGLCAVLEHSVGCLALLSQWS
jgi:hypothetical protein